MSKTDQCRDVKQLNPLAQQACNLFLDELKKNNIKMFITETYRSQERQNWLYEQGRTRPGIKVTWTRKSEHTGRMAWDMACSPPQELYDESVLLKAGKIAQKLGITWGGSWKGTVDSPHFEITNSWKPPKKEVINMEQNTQTVSTWAKEAWEWAKNEKLIDGTRPKDCVTREELATVMYRIFAKLKQ